MWTVYQHVDSVETPQRPGKCCDALCGQIHLGSNPRPRVRVPLAKALEVSQPNLLKCP